MWRHNTKKRGGGEAYKVNKEGEKEKRGYEKRQRKEHRRRF